MEEAYLTDRPEGAAFFEELRSEEIQEVLSNKPPWAVRWGNTVFLVILLSILGLSWLIKYPEIIVVPFRLTSDDVPKPVVAKANGRLVKLWVKENQYVEKGKVLAYIESTASHSEVLALQNSLDSLAVLIETGHFEDISSFRAGSFQHLGELQSDYQTFMQQFSETAALFTQGYLAKKKDFLRYEISDLEQNHEQLLEQYDIQNQDFRLAEKEFGMHKKLYEQKVIAWVEYNREERNFLAKKMPLKQLEMSITNNQTAQTQKQRELAELEKQANAQKIQFSQSINSLRANVASWKARYIPTAPRSGQVYFTALWQEEQNVKNEEVLFYVGTSQKGYFGELNIPQANAGKIQVGQWVLIKFQSFPFEQFGMVKGQIKSVASILSTDTTFRAIVTLPKGLTTTSHKTLPFKNNLNASAEIITQDVSVAERMFYQLKKLINQ
ncbi:hypothetical protein DR864_15275 [Runella rosea]|uniref:Uncharacterized protein n=1 Tax=Runella rosea TaxID=2259595 RepID=A0A344TK42_9BACT|nr:HlyD family efflux transporter periplasmic adaptor subunit [Runella rosea]AXE19013.1 hypothetical protein DR864_15275 [Runella rosea]